jgi:ParB family chromosome partitioning protein
MRIKIADIIIPEGRREIAPDKVAALAESIKIIGGLIHPITIDKDRTLIAGLHRIEAYKALGFDEIECTEFDGEDLEAELVEIDENLMRNELDDITVGEMILRRDEILEELGLRKKSGDNRFTDRGAGDAPLQTTADIAKEVGISERTLQENKQLAKNLIPEAKEARREKRITKDAALAIARLSPEQQRKTLEKCEQKGSGQIGKDGKIRPEQYAPRKMTVAKNSEPEEPEDYINLPYNHNGEFIKFALPLDAVSMSATINQRFRRESRELREKIVKEVEGLAVIVKYLVYENYEQESD